MQSFKTTASDLCNKYEPTYEGGEEGVEILHTYTSLFYHINAYYGI